MRVIEAIHVQRPSTALARGSLPCSWFLRGRPVGIQASLWLDRGCVRACHDRCVTWAMARYAVMCIQWGRPDRGSPLAWVGPRKPLLQPRTPSSGPPRPFAAEKARPDVCASGTFAEALAVPPFKDRRKQGRTARRRRAARSGGNVLGSRPRAELRARPPSSRARMELRHPPTRLP